MKNLIYKVEIAYKALQIKVKRLLRKSQIKIIVGLKIKHYLTIKKENIN